MRRFTVLSVIVFLCALRACLAAVDWGSAFGVVCPWSGVHETGVGWVRCGAGATALGNWCEVEKEKGNFSWDASDAELKGIIDQGLTPLPILGYTPPWASSGAKKDASAPPKNLLDYANFVRETVGRYSGDIPCWEVWNEPDIGFWTGSICNYTDLLRTAYTSAKTVDPGCKVVFGGTAGVNLPFVERVYDFGGRNFFDVMAVHPYQWGDTFNDDAFISQLIDLRKLMNSRGDTHKEIWLTELGWSTGDKKISEEVQARLLTQVMVTALSLKEMGVTRSFWFCVKDWGAPGYGLIRENGARKPAFEAYSTLTKGLKGMNYVGRAPLGDGVRCHIFSRSTGAVTLVLWASEEKSVDVPAPSLGHSQVECYNYLGEKIKIRYEDGLYKVRASQAPVFIVRAGKSVLKKVERLRLPEFTPIADLAASPQPVWMSLASPEATTRPFLTYGSKCKLYVRLQNQDGTVVQGKVTMIVEGMLAPKPVDYKLAGNSSTVLPFVIDVPAVGRRGLVKVTARGDANGKVLAPLDAFVRVSGGQVIEFLANSAAESRYLHNNEGSGTAPSVRFGGTWTYKFDLGKVKFAKLEANIGANQANEWSVLASNDEKQWKTVLSGRSSRSWQSARLDEFVGKPLYLKFEGEDQQLEELVLFLR